MMLKRVCLQHLQTRIVKFTPFEVMFGRKAVLPVDVAGKMGIPDPSSR